MLYRTFGRYRHSAVSSNCGIFVVSRVCNTKWELLGLLGRVGRRHGWRVRLFGRTFLSCLHWLAWLLHVWLIWIHRVGLRWLRVLAWLAWLLRLLRWIGLLPTTCWQRLTVCAIELCVRWRVLTAPDGVCGDESLGLGAYRREDALLREALTVGAAAILRLIEARAANLASPTIATCDRGSLTRCRLGWGVLHLRLVWRCIHLRRCRQRAILIGMLGLEGLHRGRLLREGLRDGRNLILPRGVLPIRRLRRPLTLRWLRSRCLALIPLRSLSCWVWIHDGLVSARCCASRWRDCCCRCCRRRRRRWQQR